VESIKQKGQPKKQNDHEEAEIVRKEKINPRLRALELKAEIFADDGKTVQKRIYLKFI